MTFASPSAEDGDDAPGASPRAAGRGMLLVVATPIGNLDDLSQRQRAALAEADLIAAEDTRHTGRLLARIGLQVPLLSLHEHNERERLDAVLGRLERGQRIALVSDAGTPLISDPGYHLVLAARRAGHAVIPIPGPCAAIAALSVAGLPTDRFVFEGFLPSKPSARRRRLQELGSEARTMVFYEAVHRLAQSLSDLAAAFGAARPAFLARELTKRHEQLYDGALAEIAAAVQAGEIPLKGECVLVVAGDPGAEAPAETEARRVLALLTAVLPERDAVELAAAITGARRNALKRLLHAAEPPPDCA